MAARPRPGQRRATAGAAIFMRLGTWMPPVSMDRPTAGWSSETVLVRTDDRAIARPAARRRDLPAPTTSPGWSECREAGRRRPSCSLCRSSWSSSAKGRAATSYAAGRRPLCPGDAGLRPAGVGPRLLPHEAVVDVRPTSTADATGADSPWSVDDELAWWRSYLDWYDGDVPALSDALAAC